MKKIQVIALENVHTSKKTVSGGDLLLSKMVPYLSSILSISVIIPKLNTTHWNNKNVKLYILPVNPFDGYKNPFLVFISYLFRCVHSYFLLIKLNPTVIYSSTNVMPDILPGFLYKLTHWEVKWISRIHHLITHPFQREGNLLINFFSFTVESLMLSLMEKADKVIALNTLLEERLRKRGFAENKTTTITAGVDYDKIRKLNKNRILYDGVFIGRFHRTKGIFDIPKIWKMVVSKIPYAKLGLIGESEITVLNHFKKMLLKYHLTDNVDIFGYLPEKRMLDVLKSSKVFLFTDHEAGFGLAAVSAMAAGIPIVGYTIGLIGNVLKKGCIGVSLYKYDAFAKQIVKLLVNKKYYSKMSEEARIEAKKYSWKIPGKQLSNLILHLLFPTIS